MTERKEFVIAHVHLSVLTEAEADPDVILACFQQQLVGAPILRERREFVITAVKWGTNKLVAVAEAEDRPPSPERWGEGLEPIYATIGKNIRRERTRQDLTQKDLADRVGLTRASVVNIEGGRQRLLPHDLECFARVLGTTVPSLLAEGSEQHEAG